MLQNRQDAPEAGGSSNPSLSQFAKKSLGQNFLKSERALLDMVEAGDIRAGETIIEIGPGKGALTTKLLAKIKETSAENKGKNKPDTKLICIEKDDRLIPMLQEEYRNEIKDGVLQIIHGDIIEILNNKQQVVDMIGDKSYKIIANIPYYITGLIFRGIFELEHLPEKIVLLVQKEVANRIIAYGDNGEQRGGQAGKNDKNAGKESILSISIKLYGEPRRVSIVPRGAFVPAPAVDSAIVSVENIKRKIPKDQDSRFFDMIHAAFSHKRKRLAKNLEAFSISHVESGGDAKKYTSADYENALVALGLDKNVRAEDISIETYIQLFERLVY